MLTKKKSNHKKMIIIVINSSLGRNEPKPADD